MIRKNLLSSKSIQFQLMIAFCLVSVIPILALLNYVFPGLFPRVHLDVIIFTVLGMATIGFFLMKSIIDPIVEMNSDIKVINKGEVSHKVEIVRDDEIGQLGRGLNQLTQRIRGHMDELKIYGERSKAINLQINQQTVALNALSGISNLIANGIGLNEIFEMTITKLPQISNSSVAFLVSKKDGNFAIPAHFGLGTEVSDSVKTQEKSSIFDRLFSATPYLKIDNKTTDATAGELLEFFSVKNLLAFPINVRKESVSVLGVGNPLSGFEYSEDDIELINIFTKQLAIAFENNLLQVKLKDLELRDLVTGLYNKRYITERLEEEILRAIPHQQPCSFILAKIVNLKEIQSKFGDAQELDILKKMASTLKDCSSEIDRVGRIEDSEFAIVMPGKNKKQAQEFSQELNNKIQKAFRRGALEKRPSIKIAVVENPIDGADSTSLIEKVKKSVQT